MIPVKFTFKGETKKVQVPESWKEVTFSQMLRLQKGENFAFVFSGIDEKDWLDADNAEAYIKFNYLLGWTKEKANFGGGWKIKIGDKEINFKGFEVKLESIGQYLDCEQIISQYAKASKKKRVEGLLGCYPQIIAIYCQKELDGEYNYFGRSKKSSMERKRIKELTDLISENPYGVVFNVGNFFLSNMRSLTGGVPVMWRLYSYLMRKFEPVRRIFPPSMELSQTSLQW